MKIFYAFLFNLIALVGVWACTLHILSATLLGCIVSWGVLATISDGIPRKETERNEYVPLIILGVLTWSAELFITFSAYPALGIVFVAGVILNVLGIINAKIVN